MLSNPIASGEGEAGEAGSGGADATPVTFSSLHPPEAAKTGCGADIEAK